MREVKIERDARYYQSGEQALGAALRGAVGAGQFRDVLNSMSEHKCSARAKVADDLFRALGHQTQVIVSPVLLRPTPFTMTLGQFELIVNGLKDEAKVGLLFNPEYTRPGSNRQVNFAAGQVDYLFTRCMPVGIQREGATFDKRLLVEDAIERLHSVMETIDVANTSLTGLRMPGSRVSARLLVVAASHQISRIELDSSITVGRKSTGVEYPNDTALSAQHFKITNVGTECTVEDLNSTNGLWINGRRATRHVLRHGDRIHAGSQDFIYHESKLK